MCTGIVENTRVSGDGKGTNGWFPLDHASVAYDRNVSLLSSDQGRPQTHPDNSALYPAVRNDIVQSKCLVREEEYTRNNIGKGCLQSQGNCEACQPCHGESLKLGSDTRNYQHSGNGDYNPGYPNAITDIPNELLGYSCLPGSSR